MPQKPSSVRLSFPRRRSVFDLWKLGSLHCDTQQSALQSLDARSAPAGGEVGRPPNLALWVGPPMGETEGAPGVKLWRGRMRVVKQGKAVPATTREEVRGCTGGGDPCACGLLL
jgi:hypothetical protein